MRRFSALLAAAVAGATVVSPAVAHPAGAAEPPAPTVHYLPPVDGPIVDAFRPPASDYGAGNRGIDYGVEEGRPVAASAAGEVVFAGRVGNDLHVVVVHTDGIRTSYSFLSAAQVRRGDRVDQGQVVGTAGANGLHFGARVGDKTYLDPMELLGRRRVRVHLVDDDDTRPLAEVVERRNLIESLPKGPRDWVRRGVRWVWDKADAKVRETIDLALVVADGLVDLSIPVPVHLVVAAIRWEEAQKGCTPPGTAIPPYGVPPPPRVAILVGGLASATGDANILEVDTRALGYGAGDVEQFSYRADGGPYDARDSQGDLDQAGRRLALRIAEVQRDRPGALVDVLAHSQGGLVARSAVTRHGARPATLVTLATPHGGTELASAAAGVNGTSSGHLILEGAGAAGIGGIDPNSTSVLQMSETSDFLDDLRQHGRWPPADVTFVVSIAARSDAIVPAHHSWLDGVENVTVTPQGSSGRSDHERLPGSGEATTEIARALRRQPPTCRSLPDTLLDTLSSRQAADAQERAALALVAAGVYLDRRTAGRAEVLMSIAEAGLEQVEAVEGR